MKSGQFRYTDGVIAGLCTPSSPQQNFLSELCQEIRPVGLVMSNRLLIVATSGEG
jgi:hypothetical protein